MAVLIVALIFFWQYRDPLTDAYRAFREGAVAEAAVDSVQVGPGRPSGAALRTALEKYESMAETPGPGFVVLTTAEMASLIQDGLDPIAQQALDSLLVTFEDGRFILEAVLITEVWGREALGPFAAMLQPREPLRVAGPARAERAGVIAWEPDEFTVRNLPFPKATIPALVKSLTGGSGGAILLVVPATVGDVRIRPEGVTFYRRIQ
jgi:hypothetical protein